MTKTKLLIKDFEDKMAKSGKSYTRFNTSIGWCSAFDVEVIKTLKSCCGGGALLVDMVEKDNFKNINAVLESETDSELVKGAKEILRHHNKAKPDTQTQIVRMASLKAVVELAKVIKPEEHDLIKLAEEFEQWILR